MQTSNLLLTNLKKFGRQRIFLPITIVIISLIGIALAMNANRYYLVAQDKNTYKIDKWTGKTFKLTSYGFVEIRHRTKDELKDLLEEKKGKEAFPLGYLIIKDTQGLSSEWGESISFTITNSHTTETASSLVMRVRFYSDKQTQNEIDTKDFFFGDFSISQIPPQTTKKLITEIFDRPINQYWFVPEIVSAKIK